MQKLHAVEEYPLVERQLTAIIGGNPVKCIRIAIPDLNVGEQIIFPANKKYKDMLVDIVRLKMRVHEKGNEQLLRKYHAGHHHPEPSNMRESISQIKEEDYTPARLAKASGGLVSKETIIRACKSEKLKFNTTPGGHFKIPYPAACDFLRDLGVELT